MNFLTFCGGESSALNRHRTPALPSSVLLAVIFLLALAVPIAHGANQVFDVMQFGAAGDGVTLDSAAIQRAIDAAAATGGGAEVLVPRHHQFLTGTLELRGGIIFHLEGDLIISTNRADYHGDGVIIASNAVDLKITGRGSIQGRSLSFMTNYDKAGEWWLFGPWRVKMFLLTRCTNLEIRDLTFGDAPWYGLHLLGCKNVLVDHITITNRLDVPNCDGIGPDHCQDVQIRHCRITSGDDCIVIKSTRQTGDVDYGPCANITVSDCVLNTQDSGVKIGTETFGDIHDVLFERCQILSGGRGLTIQLRDEGNVYNVKFQDIRFVARYFSDPWWGRGEAISLTALPRTAETKLGTMHDIILQNVTGRAENSARIQGSDGSRIHDVQLDSVNLTLDRWTKYPGRLFDNRPTKVLAPIEEHDTPGFSIRNADHVTLKDCAVHWGGHAPDYFSSALEAENVTELHLTDFNGKAAHPKRGAAVVIH